VVPLTYYLGQNFPFKTRKFGGGIRKVYLPFFKIFFHTEGWTLGILPGRKGITVFKGRVFLKGKE